jgi:hypothetical protein
LMMIDGTNVRMAFTSSSQEKKPRITEMFPSEEGKQ